MLYCSNGNMLHCELVVFRLISGSSVIIKVCIKLHSTLKVCFKVANTHFYVAIVIL